MALSRIFCPPKSPPLVTLPESSMTTAAGSLQIVPESPPSAPALRAADRGVAEALESVLSDNTRRVYQTQWKLFDEWCGDVGLRSLPAEPLTVARYLAVRANAGASIATLRLATSAIAKVHEWADHESPGRDQGVRASLKGWGRRLAKPQRQAGALTADVLAVIRLTAPKPRARGRGLETAEQAAQRARFDLALVAVLSDAGLRRSEASSLTWCPGATLCAGTTAAAASPSSAPRPTSRPRARWWPSLPPRLTLLTRYGRRAFVAMRKCSGCRSPRSPGG